jgi:hypothetical protein
VTCTCATHPGQAFCADGAYRTADRPRPQQRQQ